MTKSLCRKAGRIAILGFVASMLSSVATAQNVPGDIPGLGAVGFVSIQSLALGDGMIYAGSFGAGVFKSDDAGQTWFAANEGLSDPFVYAVTVAPDKSVFAGTLRGGVFRSLTREKTGFR